MNLQQNTERLRKINEDQLIQNFIAQANSRYILLSTSESKENFPPYTIQDANLNVLAFYYLEIGCSFGENQDMESAREPMEKGATILEYVHSSINNKKDLSNYYSLIAALAYYVAFQYSKSFIIIRKTESTTTIANLISLFLRREINELNNQVANLATQRRYSNGSLVSDDEDSSDLIYTIVIAKALDGFVKYFQTGNTEYLYKSKNDLGLLKEIAELKNEPAIWWVVRILLLISSGFDQASLWNSLLPYFDVTSQTVKKYIHSLVYLPKGIYELFITQRKALPQVLKEANTGCIVTIPTSSGKTRIAELAILKCMVEKSTNKVLYIAPFRSLAFEIETIFEKTLSNVGIISSHLYGGSLYSRLDEEIIDESNVIIATPEKAKAILRSNRDLVKEIKLIIIDEGHLFGSDKRLIINEIFYEELRYFVETNGGKFLLLSAVLPNSEDLALWLTRSTETVYKDTWRPSDERIGFLEWNGEHVNLSWVDSNGDTNAFNNKFIASKELPLVGKQRKIRYFPGDKNDAVASTAYKLRSFGTALIFVGIKDSVFTMAQSYLKALGDSAEDIQWHNSIDWKAYELSCSEAYGENNDWLSYAKKGILCHHSSLHADVRLPLERLMRSSKPHVIISTSTLGQGVNLGVSTVIFSTLYQAGELISSRDFWNIAGRAGRAFVDHESKILVAMDLADSSKMFSYLNNFRKWPRTFRSKKAQAIKSAKKRISSDYFNKNNIDIASSGILASIIELKSIAEKADIDFDTFLQLIAENKIDDIGEEAKSVDDRLDWIDDALLSLQELHNSEGEVDYSWIEMFFSNSLAYIQIKEDSKLSKDSFLSFIKSRTQGIVRKVGEDRNKWASIIKSGIPLNSDLFIETKLLEIIEILTASENLQSIDNKIEILKGIIHVIHDIPVFDENISQIDNGDFDQILERWLKAVPIASIKDLKLCDETISKLFTYKLPWILNGIAKKLKNLLLEDEADIVEEIAMLVETGVSDLRALKVYQAGIRSRVCAQEFATLMLDEFDTRSSKEYKLDILRNHEVYKLMVSEKCGDWIDLLLHMNRRTGIYVNPIPPFKLSHPRLKGNILIPRIINDLQYLITPDFSFFRIVEKTQDYSLVSNVPGIFFVYNPESRLWVLTIENPFVYVQE